MGTSAKEKDGKGDAKTVRNSPTLIGAAVGTAGGPLWALVGTGLANVATGYPKTEWETINTSAALLLMLVNVAVLVMGLVVASRCASAGNPSPAEFAGALLLTVPYVVYRAFSPCAKVGGILGNIGDLNKTMAPVVLYQMGGYRRAAAASAAAAAAAAATVGGGRRV